MWRHPFEEVISTRKVRAEDGTLFLDLKCGDLMQQKITRIQTDQVIVARIWLSPNLSLDFLTFLLLSLPRLMRFRA